MDAHLAGCAACRAWLTEIHERLGHLACIEFVELVTEYLDDSVDDGLRARIKDHLRLCEGCRNYLDEMRSTVATIGRPLAIDTSDNRPRTAHRLGRLRFMMAGLDLSLTAYRVGGGESGALFVPFRDETSGRETYGAGRYLDIEPEADGSYVLDFNDAYHPYCAYSDSYSCPLPPAENRLPLPIEAGERLGVPFRSEAEV